MNRNVILWLILILAFVLRFYKLAQIPLSLDWDENSNAYNAYSILKTGRDEYGNFLPITNRSFEDYKPPLYMYLNVPTVAIFGLTPFAARLPSAVFGFLTVPAIYFLAKKLFSSELVANQKHDETSLEIRSKSKNRSGAGGGLSEAEKEDQTKRKVSRAFFDGNKPDTVVLLATFFLAISPWHLQFSRVGFEATVGLFFAVAAITSFLYGLKSKGWLTVSGIFLGISAYSYHAERIFVPLLFIATFFIFRREIFLASKKYLVLFVTITILIGLPLVVLIPPKVILQRFEVTTGRPRLEDIEKSIKFILQDQERGSKIGNYIHNRRLVIGQTYVGNYLAHFDFNFLFTKGDDNFRHHIDGMGMLYLFQFPLVIYGIYLLVKNRNKSSVFLLAWLVIAPIPATPAVPNPHANRSLPMDTVFQIISAYALVVIFGQKFKLKRLFLYGLLFWIITSLAIYFHNYWSHYPFDKASFWQYGYREASVESEKIKDQYEKINIDHSIEQAYIFWLFNIQYNPASYQQQGSRYHFDKYYFDAKLPSNKNELFISDVGNFPGGFEVIKTIYYPDGTEAIKIGHPK